MVAILTLLGVIVGALITAGSSFVLEERRQKWASEERKYATAEMPIRPNTHRFQ